MDGINRLRDWLKGRLLMGNGWNELNEIADAIESEVKANRVDAYTKGYDEGFASADDLAAQHEDAMAEHGWVRLPVDADGEPIHVGDVMEWPDGNTFEVRGFGGNTLFYIDGGHCEWTSVGMKRHHRVSTVEDVLDEFVARWMDTHHDDLPALKAEYAAKLRLAGDE